MLGCAETQPLATLAQVTRALWYKVVYLVLPKLKQSDCCEREGGIAHMLSAVCAALQCKKQKNIPTQSCTAATVLGRTPGLFCKQTSGSVSITEHIM